jgi:hypothetical protein
MQVLKNSWTWESVQRPRQGSPGVAQTRIPRKDPQFVLLGISALFLFVVGFHLILSAKGKAGAQVKKLNARMIALITVFSFGGRRAVDICRFR